MTIKTTLILLSLFFISACNTKPVSEREFQIHDHAFLQTIGSATAVILCHGRGKHPRWLVVDPLRKQIHKQMGFHTLSLQMPIDDEIDWQDYRYLFPQAFQTIKDSIIYLKEKHQVEKVFLIGHSMGSRMASAYLASTAEHGITGFIGIGMRNNGEHPLDASVNLSKIKLPVLDLFGNGGNLKDFYHAKDRSPLISKLYKQQMVKNADHKFTQHQQEMVKSVIHWLETKQVSSKQGLK